jgi:pimeloyl-ACP methyl ester carboxylesterase
MAKCYQISIRMCKPMRILIALLILTASALADDWPKGKVSDWNGYQRLDFKLPGDGAHCIVVTPKKAAPDNPWVWRARFWGHQSALDLALLKKGFHLTYCEVGGLFGAPSAVKRWDAFYALATERSLSKKPILEGMSRGGLIITNWASANPDKVAAIYGDNPVCNFNSWPGGKNGKFSKGDWQRCLKAYEIKAEAGALHPQPLSPATLKPLAARKVPYALVLGMADKVVPVAENGEALAKNYEMLGGPVRIWRKPGKGHHPHGLHPPDELLAYLLKAVNAGK